MTPKKSAPHESAAQSSPEHAAVNPPAASAVQEASFEESFTRLEQLVAEMERADLPLEELLARFEEGVKLVKHCEQFLRQAQQRVLRFVEQKDGHWVLKELEAQD